MKKNRKKGVGSMIASNLMINEICPLITRYTAEIAEDDPDIKLRNEIKKVVRIIKSKKSKEFISKHIQYSKDVRFGEPVIKGTRITVNEIAESIIDEKLTPSETIKHYPSIENEEQISAAMIYYFSKKVINQPKFLLYVWFGIKI